jgi:pumilio RNA-binding family
MFTQSYKDIKGYNNERKYSDGDTQEKSNHYFNESKKKIHNLSLIKEQNDLDGFLPKFLVNDLNNITIDGEENTTITTDVHELSHEEGELREMNPHHFSSNEKATIKQQYCSSFKFNKNSQIENTHVNQLIQANRNKYYSSGDVKMNSFGCGLRREPDNYFNQGSQLQGNFNSRFNKNFQISNQKNFHAMINNQGNLGNQPNYVGFQQINNFNNNYFNGNSPCNNSNNYFYGSEGGIGNIDNNMYNNSSFINPNQQNFIQQNFNPLNQQNFNAQNFNQQQQHNFNNYFSNSNQSNYPGPNSNRVYQGQSKSFKLHKNELFNLTERINSSEDVVQSSFNTMSNKKINSASSTSLNKQPNCRNSSKNQLNDKEPEISSIDELLASVQYDLSSFVRTQKGSRTLQKILDKIPPEKLDIVLEKLKGDFPFLMTDTYGNYLCQKVIQCCSAEQRIYILKNIVKDFTDIACNPSGTHSLQSIIEIINLKEEEELIKECVREQVIYLSLNGNGTHVIQKIVSCLNENDRQEINYLILQNFQKLVFDSNGICVIKKFINGNENLEIRRSVVEKLKQNALEIVQNPFGNYIVQHVFDEWGVEACKEILKVVVNNVLSLSMQKFSSNVVEKCLDIADEVSSI